MRTTISLDDDLYEKARTMAFESRKTLGEVINTLLRAGLRSSQPTARVLGAYEKKIWIAEDFDETPSEVIDSISDPL